MKISPISLNVHNKTNSEKVSFCHNESFWKSDYSTKQKLLVAGTTAVGVLGSMALMAKGQGYSLNPKHFIKNFKNSYFMKADFLLKEILAMGAGTCLGGLAGGYMIDKNPKNRKAKNREAVMQIGNISIPIATVAAANKLCKNTGKAVRTVASLGAIIAGIYLANFSMNKISNLIFKDKTQERSVKATDFSPHLDDVLASAKYIAPTSVAVHYISRVVPFALMVAGNEIGNKKAN